MIIWNFPMGVPMGSPFWKEVQSEAKFGRKFMEVQGPTMLHASGQASGTVAPVAPSQGVSCRAIRPKLDVTRGQTTPKKGCFTHFYWDFTMKTCRWVAWILWPRNGFVQKLSSGKDHPCREKAIWMCWTMVSWPWFFSCVACLHGYHHYVRMDQVTWESWSDATHGINKTDLWSYETWVFEHPMFISCTSCSNFTCYVYTYIYTIYQMYGSSRVIFGSYGSRYDLRWQLTYWRGYIELDEEIRCVSNGL